MYAKVEAIKARTVGNQTRLFDQEQNTAIKPASSPKVSLTHAQRPPP
jgi:hypothetical protein